MKPWRLAAVLAIALSSTVALTGTADASPNGHGWGHYGAYTCNGSSGGVIPAGDYRSVTVTGVCYMPTGNITIQKDLTVAPGAMLDAATPGDPTSGTPVVPATVDIGGNVWVGKGAALILGCSPNIFCAPPAAGISFDEVGGSITGIGAQGVVVHSVAIGGNFSILGGGGGTAGETCDAQVAGAPTDTTLLPWSEDASLDFTPIYTDLEDSTVGGSVSVSGLSTCWLGTLRNFIGGSAYYANNTFGDPDAMEIGNNLISHDFGCWNNSPAPQFGDGADSDLVSGHASGQCGFNVVLQNPAAEAILANGETGVGVSQHFSVSTRSLGTYWGTHTATNVGTLPGYPVTTSSGDAIFAELNSFVLTGNGLTGTATYTGGAPGQAPGEADLGTQYPDGSQNFVAYDTCASCSFDGQTGFVTLRAYGTTSPHGFTQGTFLITSSGTVLPTSSSPVPGLATLVGYGTFWGSGSTVHVVEHLGFG